MILRRRWLVSGRVQGVCFRAFTAREAQEIGGLAGWVRNRADGRVEVLAEGEPAKLDALSGFLHRGSPAARVEAVEARDEPASGDLEPFSIEG